MIAPDQAISLTVAIPTYNRRDAVHALIESICKQALPCDEIIVSDDASSDGTAETLLEVQGVRVISQERNQGLVGNWNACLSAARREWICIIHDDDRLEPGGLAALRRACAAANGPALIQHDYVASRFEGGFRYRYSDPSPRTILSCPSVPSGAVLHRAVIEAVGFFDPHYKYSADLEYFPRITARFPLIVIESPRVVEFRRHAANYHFQVAHKEEFYVLYEELLRSVISYAGIEDEALRRDVLEERLMADFFYMLEMADRLGDRRLVRYIGKCCERFPHRLSARKKLMVRLAAMTGYRFRRHPVNRLQPLQN